MFSLAENSVSRDLKYTHWEGNIPCDRFLRLKLNTEVFEPVNPLLYSIHLCNTQIWHTAARRYDAYQAEYSSTR